MPRIKGIPGRYRVFFTSFDCNEPAHLYIERENSQKGWRSVVILGEARWLFLVSGLSIEPHDAQCAGVGRRLCLAKTARGQVTLHPVYLVDDVGTGLVRLAVRIGRHGLFATTKARQAVDILWAITHLEGPLSSYDLGLYGMVAVPATSLAASGALRLTDILQNPLVQALDHLFRGSVEGAVSGSKVSALREPGRLIKREEVRAVATVFARAIEDDDLCRALFFYEESLRLGDFTREFAGLPDGSDFHLLVYGDDLDTEGDIPLTRAPLAARLELSLVSAFKSIEALLGYPLTMKPYLGEALQRSFRFPGSTEKDLEAWLTHLRDVRNSASGHGSRDPNSTSAKRLGRTSLYYGDLFAVQGIARYLVRDRLGLSN